MPTTTPGCGPLPPRLSLANTRAERTEVRDVIATRRGVSSITEAVTAEQACRRARILLAQHRDNLHRHNGGELDFIPSGLPRVDPQRVADALTEWVREHPHHAGSAA